jgi:hypothetical protein
MVYDKEHDDIIMKIHFLLSQANEAENDLKHKLRYFEKPIKKENELDEKYNERVEYWENFKNNFEIKPNLKKMWFEFMSIKNVYKGVIRMSSENGLANFAVWSNDMLEDIDDCYNFLVDYERKEKLSMTNHEEIYKYIKEQTEYDWNVLCDYLYPYHS